MQHETGLPELPPSLSSLIGTAVTEARHLNPSRYQPNYNFWHASCPAACFICDAGAVIAAILIPAGDDFSSDTTVDPDAFPREWRDALLALDFARSGSLHEALTAFVQAYDPGAPFDPAPFREIDQNIFHALGPNTNGDYTDWPTFHAHLDYMDQVASQLETHDL